MSTIFPRDVADLLLAELALLVVDMDSGEIMMATRPAEALFGEDVSGGLVGQQVEDLIPENARAAHKEHRASFRNDPRTRQMGLRLSLRGRKLDGSTFPVAIRLVAGVLPSPPRQRIVVAVISDLSGALDAKKSG